MENESHIKINSTRFDDLESALNQTTDLSKMFEDKDEKEVDLKAFIDKIMANQTALASSMVKKDAFITAQNDLVEL